MRVYTVHVPPFSGRDPDPILIREGFSRTAFLFGPLWSLVHRMWLVTVAMVVFLLVLGSAMDAVPLDAFVQTVVSLAVAVLIGFHGNDWRRRSLTKRGYREVGVVAAHSLDEALARYLDAAPQPRPVRMHANPVAPPPMPIAGL
jgi:uncharacterized membrane protein YccC